MMGWVRLTADLLLEALYPSQARCMGCGSPAGADEGWLCAPCARQLKRVCDLPGPRCPRCGRPLTGRRACETCGGWPDGLISSARFVFPYRRPVSGMIRRMKYRGVARLADWMAEEMATTLLREMPGGFDIIVPVPMHRRRERLRGGNHALHIARALSRRTDIPCEEALVRVRNTRQQARLPAAGRRANLEGAFSAANVTGRRVLLVDDVLTTGATAVGCARALRAAGAAFVGFIALAGAIDRDGSREKRKIGAGR